MNKNQKTAIALTALGVTTIVAVRSTWESYIKLIQERFPQIDEKTIRKAYRKYLMKALTGAYGDMDNITEAQMDQQFLLEVQKINPWATARSYTPNS